MSNITATTIAAAKSTLSTIAHGPAETPAERGYRSGAGEALRTIEEFGDNYPSLEAALLGRAIEAGNLKTRSKDAFIRGVAQGTNSAYRTALKAIRGVTV